MTIKQIELHELEARVVRRERRVFRLTLVFSFLPVVAAAALLWMTIEGISVARTQVRKLEERLADVQETLRRSSQFEQHVYQLNWAEAKVLASQIPLGGELLMHIGEYRNQGIGWAWENTPDEGFVSPGFAGFILQEMQVVPGELSPIDALFTLPLTNQQPRPGDVVVYDADFAMFYFQDRDGKEFVVGMTPVGIVALSYDFGVRRVGVRRTGLSP